MEQAGGGSVCKDAASYCGIRDQKYPDRRPMGFPFDRSARYSAYKGSTRYNIQLYGAYTSVYHMYL